MVKGSDGETCCRLLLLEATPGSLAEARLAWPFTEVFKRPLSETKGVADQISREKNQIVFSDPSGAGCSALNVLSQIRCVHQQLPLVAILPEEGLSFSAGNLTLHGEQTIYLQTNKYGKTVSRENVEDVFKGDPQLGKLDTGNLGGVGVGLATCRAILRQIMGVFLEPNDEKGLQSVLFCQTKWS